jgi:hypothetical protein
MDSVRYEVYEGPHLITIAHSPTVIIRLRHCHRMNGMDNATTGIHVTGDSISVKQHV